jgi:nitrate/nitrite-specific signal transduction histidine kinase
MAMPNNSNNTLMPNESKLAQAEAGHYIEQQKSANFYNKVADYMFWGATSLILPVLGIAAGLVAAPAFIGGTALLTIGSIASVVTLAGSLFFSGKATEITEESNVLYSDIDSQNQARRMVQAFARAQSTQANPHDNPDKADTPYTTSQDTWLQRTGVSTADTNARWQDRIAAQADREDQIAIQQLLR